MIDAWPTFWEVPRAWPDSTIVCLAGGSSVQRADLDAIADAHLRRRCAVIAIGDSYLDTPWADVLHACDQKWWDWTHGAPTFRGPHRVTLDWYAAAQWKLHCVENTGEDGLEIANRHGIRHGCNSGYQAIGLAVHLGASRIVLSGYDLRGPHRHASMRPQWATPGYETFAPAFATLVQPLQDAGIDIVNTSAVSVLTCFRRALLRAVL